MSIITRGVQDPLPPLKNVPYFFFEKITKESLIRFQLFCKKKRKGSKVQNARNLLQKKLDSKSYLTRHWYTAHIRFMTYRDDDAILLCYRHPCPLYLTPWENNIVQIQICTLRILSNQYKAYTLIT